MLTNGHFIGKNRTFVLKICLSVSAFNPTFKYPSGAPPDDGD